MLNYLWEIQIERSSRHLFILTEYSEKLTGLEFQSKGHQHKNGHCIHGWDYPERACQVRQEDKEDPRAKH